MLRYNKYVPWEHYTNYIVYQGDEGTWICVVCQKYCHVNSIRDKIDDPFQNFRVPCFWQKLSFWGNIDYFLAKQKQVFIILMASHSTSWGLWWKCPVTLFHKQQKNLRPFVSNYILDVKGHRFWPVVRPLVTKVFRFFRCVTETRRNPRVFWRSDTTGDWAHYYLVFVTSKLCNSSRYVLSKAAAENIECGIRLSSIYHYLTDYFKKPNWLQTN